MAVDAAARDYNRVAQLGAAVAREETDKAKSNLDAAKAQLDGVFGIAVTDKSGKQSVDTASTFIFKQDYWNGLTGANPKKCLLFEGVSEGKGELEIVLLNKNGMELGSGGSVWLDLKNIKKMYQRRDLTGEQQWPASQFDSDPTETHDAVIFVHGWNTSPEGAQTTAETMFKRLWHRGFKGRYAAVRWKTYWSSAFDNVPSIGETVSA